MHASRRRCLAAVCLFAAVGGCASDSVVRPVRLEPGATYRAAAGNFTCVVPPLVGRGARESQTSADDAAAGVTFSDDFGTLLDVQSRHLADADRPAYAGPATAGAVAGDLDDRVLPALAQSSPGAAVLHRSAVTTPVGPAAFAVVSLPGGSARLLHGDDGTPFHPDAVRGVLVFEQVGWVYTVSVQQLPPTFNAPTLAPADRDARLLSDLQQAVGQMTFD